MPTEVRFDIKWSGLQKGTRLLRWNQERTKSTLTTTYFSVLDLDFLILQVLRSVSFHVSLTNKKKTFPCSSLSRDHVSNNNGTKCYSQPFNRTRHSIRERNMHNHHRNKHSFGPIDQPDVFTH